MRYRLDDICEVVRGGSPRPIMDFITDSPEGVNWLKIGDVSEHDKYFTHSAERIIRSGITKSREVKKGDLILSNSMSFGRAFITLIDGYIHDGWLRLRNNEDMIDREYLYYFLSSDLAQYQFKAVATGSVVNNLKTETVKAIEIELPPLTEQKAIAETLTCIDDKIELNNQINKNLEAQAQAIFNEWFFRKDTQNNGGVLSDIADINPPRKLAKGTVARYIEMSNLASTTAFPLGWEEKSYNGGAKFQNGDTLLARITPCLENGKGAYINFLQEGEIAFGSTEYIVITGKKGYCNEFFYFLIRYLDFQLYAAKSMTGSSGRQRVSADSIASYKMPIPSLELCEKFHEIAEQVMTSNCNRSLENRTLSKLRDTLLPKLMSGEIQIP